MSSRTVKSSYGDDIEIVSDDDWAATAGITEKGLRQWHGMKPLIVRELWERGPIENQSGKATTVLLDRIEEHFPGVQLGWDRSATSLITSPINAPAFERVTKGKRTYFYKLVAMPEIWYQKLTTDIRTSQPTFKATPVRMNGTKPAPIEEPPAIEEPQPEPITDEEWQPFVEAITTSEPLAPSLDVEIAGQVAMELLTRVVEIISAGSSSGLSDQKLRQLTTDYEQVTGRLSQRLEENDRLRRQVREVGDELHAVKMERDSLRARLRQTEANLNSALKGESAAVVTTEVMKRVNAIMRETPKPHDRGEE